MLNLHCTQCSLRVRISIYSIRVGASQLKQIVGRHSLGQAVRTSHVETASPPLIATSLPLLIQTVPKTRSAGLTDSCQLSKRRRRRRRRDGGRSNVSEEILPVLCCPVHPLTGRHYVLVIENLLAVLTSKHFSSNQLDRLPERHSPSGVFSF